MYFKHLVVLACLCVILNSFSLLSIIANTILQLKCGCCSDKAFRKLSLHCFYNKQLIVEHKCQHHCFITEVCLFHFLLSQNLQLHLWCFSWLQCLHVICFSLWLWVLRSKSFKLSAITIQLISSIPTSNCVSAVWTISRAETKLCFHLILPNCIKNTSHKRSSWMELMRYQEK